MFRSTIVRLPLTTPSLRVHVYYSLALQLPWVDHVKKRAVVTLLNVSAFNHDRASMSCLQQLDVLEAKN